MVFQDSAGYAYAHKGRFSGILASTGNSGIWSSEETGIWRCPDSLQSLQKWEYPATYIRLGTKEYFLLSSLPQKTKCKHVPVRAIPKQALNELTLELEVIKLLQTEVTPELIAQVQCYASEVMLLQVIVNLPAQGCLTYCFIVIFRHNSNESSKSQKISKLKFF